MKTQENERGASAVEAAFILPVLLLLVMGIMEFGFLFNQQISASNAAREGARYAAVHYPDDDFSDDEVRVAARNAAPTLADTTPIDISYSGGTCGPGTNVTVTVLPAQGWLIGFIPLTAPQITGVGVMRCGG
ncbi:pilus assembly protein TadE [Arthrobacter psychrolactophilus]|uniref:Pilus assembly protein TadE n=1 Tax=Arthrobacter psychrolactophilus TaxID=92442 RepID=A0A2V5IQC2_9MICC|nr:TadE family protein [Arthrobacter psychrolactophilus]PYI38755.1 pilus assembly protein TadE [Arthrobacter psychrolactophilus]